MWRRLCSAPPGCLNNVSGLDVVTLGLQHQALVIRNRHANVSTSDPHRRHLTHQGSFFFVRDIEFYKLKIVVCRHARVSTCVFDGPAWTPRGGFLVSAPAVANSARRQRAPAAFCFAHVGVTQWDPAGDYEHIGRTYAGQ